MNFWKRRYSVCRDCGVHFEPVTDDYEARWGYLCSMHRKPVKERDEKRAAVISWATANWERLVKMMEEDNEKHNGEGSFGNVFPENYF